MPRCTLRKEKMTVCIASFVIPAEEKSHGIESLLPHYGEIRRYFARFVHCSHTADDLAQETYLRALRYYRAVSPPRNLGGWLQMTAFNVAIAYIEKSRRASVVYSDDIVEKAQGKIGESNHAPDTDPSGVSPELLQKAIEQLSPSDVRLITGFYFEGRSCRELGEELGIRHGYVKTLLFRARERLRRHLQTYREA